MMKAPLAEPPFNATDEELERWTAEQVEQVRDTDVGARVRAKGPVRRGASISLPQVALRQRRDYKEVGGSPGFAIIQCAGLKAWPELTEREHRIIESRAREEAVIGTAPTLARAAAEANLLGNLGVPASRAAISAIGPE